jgi:hypothetical protein
VCIVWFFFFLGKGRGEEYFLFSFLGLVAMPLACDKNGDKQFWK